MLKPACPGLGSGLLPQLPSACSGLLCLSLWLSAAMADSIWLATCWQPLALCLALCSYITQGRPRPEANCGCLWHHESPHLGPCP